MLEILYSILVGISIGFNALALYYALSINRFVLSSSKIWGTLSSGLIVRIVIQIISFFFVHDIVVFLSSFGALINIINLVGMTYYLATQAISYGFMYQSVKDK